ncbi:MAG: hypothetical protein FJ091_05460 [Deltaproteobacteria bacterium]|nr:hypothetical protein [Deltaproteobacteria bacterium]
MACACRRARSRGALACAQLRAAEPAAQRRVGWGEAHCSLPRRTHSDATARVAIEAGVLPGTAFLSFHFPSTHANRVVGPAGDPESKCPEHKLTAVRIAPA